MRRSIVLIIWMVIFAAMICPLTSCGQTASSGTDDRNDFTPSLSSQAAARGGNLHYQNLVLAVNDQIVFNSISGVLTVASPDGGASSALAETGGSSPAFDGSQLFYISGTGGGELSKIGLDGTNQVRIGQTMLKYLISHENRLFAIESDNGLPISLKPDGTGRQLLRDIQAVALCLADNRLYISGASDESGLVMIDLETEEKEVLLNKQVSSLNVSGEWLYFADPAGNFKLNAWSVSSRSGSVISEFSIDKPFIVSAGYLYFIDTASQGRLFRLPVSGGSMLDRPSAVMVIDDAVSSFAVTGDYIYYQRPDSKRIYRVDAVGSQPLRIT